MGKLKSCATMPVYHDWWDRIQEPKITCCNEVFLFKQAGIDLNLSVMAIGATIGITYAVERMSITNGGRGGRIITTASAAGLIVRTRPGKGS